MSDKCPPGWKPGCSCNSSALEPSDTCDIHGCPDNRLCPYCGAWKSYCRPCKRCGYSEPDREESNRKDAEVLAAAKKDVPGLLIQLEDAKKVIAQLREALEEVAEGKGRFSEDPLTHAANTIEDMVGIAQAALDAAGVGKEKP